MPDLNLGELKKQVGSNLDGNYDWTAVEEGLNTIYKLESEDQEYILKVHTNDQNREGWFRAEPEIYELVSENTDVPSPEIIHKDLSGQDYENPFYLMEKLQGENPDKLKQDLSDEELGNLMYQYGEILGEIHNIPTSLERYGMVSAENGELQNTEDAEKWTSSLQETIDAWADIVEDKWDEPVEIETPEAEIRERIPEEPESVFNHSDNRLDNLLVEGDEITGFIDWSHPRTGHSEYDLARAEYLLIDRDLDFKDKETKESLRDKLYQGYRQNNSIDGNYDERRDVYRFATTAWLAAGFSNWGSQFDEETHAEVREGIVERLEEESL
jgi:Predicted aminoglycoside phosphotransferase